MTGYGRSEFKTPAGLARIEIKTTNHKYFDLSMRLPQSLYTFDERIRSQIKRIITRGKVHLFISAPETVLRKSNLYIDTVLAKEYYLAAKKLSKALGIGDQLTTAQLLRMPDVVSLNALVSEEKKLWTQLQKALSLSLTSLEKSRASEGMHLKKDVLKRLRNIELAIKRIVSRIPQITQIQKKKIKQRLGEINVDRLDQELANFSKSIDVTEESVRLASHIKTFRLTLSRGGEVGRKIDFIVQEMMRETNTTGAKCGDVIVSAMIIEIKSELEKIREQAMNLE